jgi:hypothetical protein
MADKSNYGGENFFEATASQSKARAEAVLSSQGSEDVSHLLRAFTADELSRPAFDEATLTPRFAICVWSSGARSWYWTGRISGRYAHVKLGQFPEITPEQAAKLAAKTSATVADGKDPRQAKQQAGEETTLGEAFKRFLDDHAKAHKKSWQEDEKTFNRYLARWKKRRLSSITHADVVSLHNKTGSDHGQYAANRTLSLLSTLFNKLRVSTGNPCKGVTRFKEEAKERFLDGDELQRFFKALEEEIRCT